MQIHEVHGTPFTEFSLKSTRKRSPFLYILLWINDDAGMSPMYNRNAMPVHPRGVIVIGI